MEQLAPRPNAKLEARAAASHGGHASAHCRAREGSHGPTVSPVCLSHGGNRWRPGIARARTGAAAAEAASIPTESRAAAAGPGGLPTPESLNEKLLEGDATSGARGRPGRVGASVAKPWRLRRSRWECDTRERRAGRRRGKSSGRWPDSPAWASTTRVEETAWLAPKRLLSENTASFVWQPPSRKARNLSDRAAAGISNDSGLRSLRVSARRLGV